MKCIYFQDFQEIIFYFNTNKDKTKLKLNFYLWINDQVKNLTLIDYILYEILKVLFSSDQILLQT